MLFKSQFLIVLAIIGIAFSCDDNTESIEKIDISNPDVASKAISIEGSTRKTGALPASSNNSVLQLEPLDETLQAISGTGFLLPLTEREGDEVKGVYFKVKGSTDYLDIPVSALPKLNQRKAQPTKPKGLFRTLEEDDLAIGFNLPDNIKPGMFCAEYCIYDAANNVSNIVEVCIEVLAFGGEGSEFLTKNEWKTTYTGDHDSIYSVEDTVTILDVQCNNHTGFQTLTYSQNWFWKFNPDGSFEITVFTFETDNFDELACQTTTTTEAETEIYYGAWSYNKGSENVVIVINEASYLYKKNNVIVKNVNRVPYIDWMSFDIKQENGKVRFTTPNGYFHIMKPK